MQLVNTEGYIIFKEFYYLLSVDVAGCIKYYYHALSYVQYVSTIISYNYIKFIGGDLNEFNFSGG